MIRQKIYIQKYNWRVWCYYAVDTYYATEIAEQLARIGCKGDYLFRAVTNMRNGELNHGLCYSDTSGGRSVMVIGLTSSVAEFLNSLTHELHHLTEHICNRYDVPTDSEEAAYLCGDTAQAIFLCCKSFM